MWLYVQGSGGLNLASGSRSDPNTAVWVTVSGTPTQRPCSWRGWKTRHWIERLSGTISNPSLATRTAARWISSLPDSLASLSPSLVNEKAPTTPAGSGPISPQSLATFDPDTCSWKTSQGCLPTLEDSERSSVIWPRSGSMRNGECFRRQEWERRTFGDGCSSWPAVTTNAAKSQSYTYDQGDKTKPRPALSGAAKMFPTPDAMVRTGHNTRPGPAGERPTLAEVGKQWQTPQTPKGGGKVRGGDRGNEMLLPGQAEAWATPNAHDGRRPGSDATSTQDRNLKREAEALSHRAHPTPKPGPKSSNTTRRLNPRFVEWLMGLPTGWTDSGVAVTESFPSWLRLHSECLRNVLDEGEVTHDRYR